MICRLLFAVVIFALSFAPGVGQVDTTKPSTSATTARLRDLPFPGGIDLQFLIKELARDMGLNVLFDTESFRGPRRTYIELKNVTSREALDYVILQENLYFEEAGPNTILIAARFRGLSIPQLGVGVTPMSDQLAQYFGVGGGILIGTVRVDSPASRAGLKAGDVIVEVDGAIFTGTLDATRAIIEKGEKNITLTVVRERKRQTIKLIPEKGIGSVLNR